MTNVNPADDSSVTALCFVILNEVPAGTSALGDSLTPAVLLRAAADLQDQLRNDVAPLYQAYANSNPDIQLGAWSAAVALRASTAIVRVGSGAADVGAAEIPSRIVPTLDDPGAVAYHDVEQGSTTPDVFLSLEQCNSLADVFSALSHEFCETAGDPECDEFSAVMADGKIHAIELSDAVESNSYPGLGGTELSDFLKPSFFDPQGVAPFTYMQLAGMGGAYPSGPGATATGGYQIVENADGSGETQVTSDVASRRGARALAGRIGRTSRPARRGIKRASSSSLVSATSADAGPPPVRHRSEWMELARKS